ncbi:phosphoribosylaminoimidazolecarboxamide formyltransferase / IMP cyclohydrolase [Halodesulfurarchaeum formicicum]|uniref:Phosphoribosylaminoimidazolecarboxamide formyltransferase / IMP cyclohydrolase n=1 Tax=Halodesulfurarchaeum formicicum TaxID=1873524 RepID=A0A1D8S586_9EURY|nr:bifunctional phosphoribosylaminoimidazolecarboxamide formyltransferase/IMP cyclohydrolase [Halodesulfurarchaeum formicicum]AOW80512.1 phosphoribosylaminoimidazolecarboxamide formyltransferase / IMP cyclohydrolase [Halodesulfurarchaeum formicicum]
MPIIAGLASNRGRNLMHIQDRQPGGTTLGVVVSNHADAPIIEKAENRGIDTAVVERSPGMARREHERRILQVLSDYDLDLVALDGYMRILSETFLEAAPPTLNVHPSLLPSFPGDNAHEQALDAGVAVSGCTVHLVTDAVAEDGSVIDEHVDAGPIITQEPVPVYPEDDPADLKRRVLYEGEFTAYSRAIEMIAAGQVTIEGDSVTVTEDGGAFPHRRFNSADRVRKLRYGENPHQDAALYADPRSEAASVVDADQRNPTGKALSYNNYNDADAALNLIREFEAPAAAVIKHTNPAGCAVGDSLSEAYEDALATDAKSAFGGIVALNRPCDEPTATAIVDSFKEAVVAPGYTDAALDVLTEKDDLRVLDVGEFDGDTLGQVEKPLVGGRLVQERDLQAPQAADLETVTDREPTEAELESLLFAWQTAKHVKSNAIVLASGTETVGIGMGQASRVDAVDLATKKAERDAEGKSAAGSVMASDAFFPFPDGVELAAEAGVEAVIQPGGSVNDEAVIEAANEHDLAMVFTGTRAFRHD